MAEGLYAKLGFCASSADPGVATTLTVVASTHRDRTSSTLPQAPCRRQFRTSWRFRTRAHEHTERLPSTLSERRRG